MPPNPRALAMRNEAAEGNFTGRDGKAWRVERAFTVPTGKVIELRAPNGLGGFFPIGANGVETELVHIVGNYPKNRVTGFNGRGEPIMVPDEAGAIRRVAAMAVEKKRVESRLAKPGTIGTTEHVIFPGGTGSTTTGYGSAEYDNNTSYEALAALCAGIPDEALVNFGASFTLGRLLAGTTTDLFRLMRNGGATFDLTAVGSDIISAANLYFNERTNTNTFAGADLQAVVRAWTPSVNYSFVLGDFAKAKYGAVNFSDAPIDFSPVADPYTIAMNAAGIAHLQASAGAIAALGFMLRDVADVALDGTWGSSKDKEVNVYGTDQSGDTLDLRLNITSAPAPASGSMLSPLSIVTRLA